MNKTEKLICLLLGALLVGYIFYSMGQKKNAAVQGGEAESRPAASEVQKPEVSSNDPAPVKAVQEPAAPAPAPAEPSVPEQIVVLENDDVKLELSTWGAVVKSAVLKKYARDCGEISQDNPAIRLDLSASPIGRGPKVESFKVLSQTATNAVFRFGTATRSISLGKDYLVTFDDAGLDGDMSLGVMAMGGSKNDLLSIDSWALDEKGGKVIHHCEGDSPFKAYLVGGLGGCGGSKDASGLETERTIPYNGSQKWIAVKNRFFVTAFVSSTVPNSGFAATVARDTTSQSYRPASVSATVKLDGAAAKRSSVFYIGPKKQALLWDLGMKDVMEFGMWRWLCYPLVWVLNLFNDWIPNYGVAIILLTILVRLVFWPLTRKSTEGMKKMQELQPKMKEIQKKFKDNPQRLQQETWQLYRNEKVNPASSCLPMLIQIPVFIALFNVLRSAVELRYAPFLWIADLSEPEGLFSAYLPFGGLNILPILMALSTGLQSAFTPSSGDKNQQRMMMIFMPAMMLFMFYSFPSALSLYWFLSNLFSIVQMWLIRRQTAKKQDVLTPEVIDPPVTRQMRRHG